jgi:hypothetical protein
MVASVVLSSPVARAATKDGRSIRPLQPLHLFHSVRHLAPRMDVGAPSRQTVQSGAITKASQLEEPESQWDSTWKVGTQAITPQQADDTNLLFLACVHVGCSSQTYNSGYHFSYKDSGMLFGWAERGVYTFSDGNIFAEEYVASAYSTPDSAQNAYNALTSFYATLSQYSTITGANGTNCSFAGVSACYQVTIPGVLTSQQSGTNYDGVVRILLQSNSVFEGAYFINHEDYDAANKSIADSNMDIMSNYYAKIFQGAPSTTPTPTSVTPTPPKITPTPPKITPTPPKTTPTTTTTTSPTPVTPVQVQFTVTRVFWEKATAAGHSTDKALKKGKPGTKVRLIAVFRVDSAPASLPVTVKFQVMKGGKAVAGGSQSGTLDPSDPTGIYPVPIGWTLPKKLGSYVGVATVQMSGQSQSGKATIKVVKA